MLVPIYKAQELVDYLLGSCYTIEDALVAVLEVESLDELENELEVLELIDRQIFRCEQCDWWWSVKDVMTLKKNKYEEYYTNLVKWAKDNHQKREASPPQLKEIPEHMVVREVEPGSFSMYNTRLAKFVYDDFGWVGEFETPEGAKHWYRSLL